jgi:hypothetical protein
MKRIAHSNNKQYERYNGKRHSAIPRTGDSAHLFWKCNSVAPSKTSEDVDHGSYMKVRHWHLGVFLGVSVNAFCLTAGAGERGAALEARPIVQPNDCVTRAASFHQVNAWVVRAILKVESNFNAGAVNLNSNGTQDVGVAQINSIHFDELKKKGIAPSDLMNGCISSYVAAWHLRKQIKAYGNTWFAVGAYHSATPCYNRRYSALVWNTLLSWRTVSGAALRVPSIDECRAS